MLTSISFWFSGICESATAAGSARMTCSAPAQAARSSKVSTEVLQLCAGIGEIAAADVGGIAHPVAGGGALPGDGDVDVDAGHAGEDGGGEFGGELEQGGGAGWAGADADLAEAFAEPAGADRLAGASAGQQPWGGALVSGGGVAVAGGGQVKDEAGERLGQHDGFPAQPQRYLVTAGLDV